MTHKPNVTRQRYKKLAVFASCPLNCSAARYLKTPPKRKTMKPKTEIIERYKQLQLEEAEQPLKQFWCSMADPNLPKGSQFLGAVVVNARGAATATHELNLHGLNLGGEIMFFEIPDNKQIPDEWMYRVMNKQEAQDCPAITR